MRNIVLKLLSPAIPSAPFPHKKYYAPDKPDPLDSKMDLNTTARQRDNSCGFQQSGDIVSLKNCSAPLEMTVPCVGGEAKSKDYVCRTKDKTDTKRKCNL
jgi:hypothetical protein